MHIKNNEISKQIINMFSENKLQVRDSINLLINLILSISWAAGFPSHVFKEIFLSAIEEYDRLLKEEQNN